MVKVGEKYSDITSSIHLFTRLLPTINIFISNHGVTFAYEGSNNVNSMVPWTLENW